MGRTLQHGLTLAAFSLVLSGCSAVGASSAPDGPLQLPERHTLLLVLDGLRPDYISPERMPRLASLREEGAWSEWHHAVFPTVTRVNAPSLVTGAAPGVHGLMENAIHVPAVSRDRVLNTGSATELMRAEAAWNGELLTAPDLAELLAEAGKRLMVTSSGSPGSAYLLNHRTPTGPVLNNELVVPDTLAPHLDALLGPLPPPARPNRARNRRAVDAYLEFGIPRYAPHVVVMWLNDPDGTAHAEGIGSPVTLEALAHVDEEVGRILDTLDARGFLDRTDIIITSDHGFSTHVGTGQVEALLVEQGLKESIMSSEVVVAGGGIYVYEGGPQRVEAIVRLLQDTPWVGAVFTRGEEPGDVEGRVPGTLSFASIHYDHPRAPDILFSADWSDEVNAWGWTGSTWQSGTAGHGTSSPWDIRATLLAVGPSFRKGFSTPLPTGHRDIAPTILHLHGLTPPPSMQGRVLRELLEGGPAVSEIATQQEEHTVTTRQGGRPYRLSLFTTRADGADYVRHTRVDRSP
jgi:predicted AlkP superfamily pyrophosphatase or phosphodiesterase